MRELKTPESRYITVIVGADGSVSMEFEERARHTKSKSMYCFRGHWSLDDIRSERIRKDKGQPYSRNPYLTHYKKGSDTDARRLPWRGGGWVWMDSVIQNDITPTVMAFIESDAYEQERRAALISRLSREIEDAKRSIVRLHEDIAYKQEDIEEKTKQLAELEAE